MHGDDLIFGLIAGGFLFLEHFIRPACLCGIYFRRISMRMEYMKGFYSICIWFVFINTFAGILNRLLSASLAACGCSSFCLLGSSSPRRAFCSNSSFSKKKEQASWWGISFKMPPFNPQKKKRLKKEHTVWSPNLTRSARWIRPICASWDTNGPQQNLQDIFSWWEGAKALPTGDLSCSQGLWLPVMSAHA